MYIPKVWLQRSCHWCSLPPFALCEKYFYLFALIEILKLTGTCHQIPKRTKNVLTHRRHIIDKTKAKMTYLGFKNGLAIQNS